MDATLWHNRLWPYITHKAIIAMFLAIKFIIMSYTFRFIPILGRRFFQSLQSGFGDLILIIFYLSFIFAIIGFILILVSILLFNKGKDEFGEDHRENLKWTKWIAVIYIIIFITLQLIWLYTRYAENISGYIFFSFLTDFLNIFQGVVIALLLFLPVKAIAGKTEKDLLVLFAIFIVIANIGVSIYNLVRPFTNTFFRLGYFNIVTITISIGFIFVFFFSSVAYLLLLKWIKLLGPDLPSNSKGLFSRSRTISKKIDGLLQRPMQTLTVLIIIGLIFGAAEGLNTRSEMLNYGSDEADNYGEKIASPQLLRGKLAYSDDLTEGTTMPYDCEMNEYVMIFNAELTWNDEPNEQYRINQPDCFTINVTLGNLSKTETRENAVYDPGTLLIQFNFDEESAVFVEEAKIKVTLVYAGDHTGPLGLDNSPATIADDSNSYTLVIDYCCCLKDQ